jgi:prepilin-type N-terminal cleavage/methylation domain-containing protein
MYKFLTKFHKKRGFTLVEVLVAVSIFSVSIVGIMTVLGKSISDTEYAQRKMISEYLAQEGVEYIRNMRDTFVLYAPAGQNGWDLFNNKLISASCNNSAGCYFNPDSLNYASSDQPITDIPVLACSGSCPQIMYNSSNGKYNYASGTSFGYRRQININISVANEMKVTSTVVYLFQGTTYSVSLSEILFNWVE